MSVDDVCATVLPWEERPKSQPPLAACALLICNANRGAKLYVNYDVGCSHDHLAVDANALIAAFDKNERDSGWGATGNGDYGTWIGTRQAASEAGVRAWPSPPK
jgi:hypothetical protein